MSTLGTRDARAGYGSAAGWRRRKRLEHEASEKERQRRQVRQQERRDACLKVTTLEDLVASLTLEKTSPAVATPLLVGSRLVLLAVLAGLLPAFLHAALDVPLGRRVAGAAMGLLTGGAALLAAAYLSWPAHEIRYAGAVRAPSLLGALGWSLLPVGAVAGMQVALTVLLAGASPAVTSWLVFALSAAWIALYVLPVARHNARIAAELFAAVEREEHLQTATARLAAARDQLARLEEAGENATPPVMSSESPAPPPSPQTAPTMRRPARIPNATSRRAADSLPSLG